MKTVTKMFLTRIGFGSKVIITGDLTQKDLPSGQISGLDVSLKVLEGIEEIGFSYLTSKDVVRHPLVQKIVTAYEKYEEKENRKTLKVQMQKNQIQKIRIPKVQMIKKQVALLQRMLKIKLMNLQIKAKALLIKLWNR